MKNYLRKIVLIVMAISLFLGNFIAIPREVYASQPVLSDICDYCVNKNNVYTVSAKRDKIICYNIKSKKTKILYTGAPWALCVKGNYLYFLSVIDGHHAILDRYDLKKNKLKTIVSDNFCQDYVITGNYIYIEENQGGTGYIYRFNLDGKKRKLIKSFNSDNHTLQLYKLGDKVVYRDRENPALYDLKGNKYKMSDIARSNPLNLDQEVCMYKQKTFYIDDYDDKYTYLIKGSGDDDGNDFYDKKIRMKGSFVDWSQFGEYLIIQTMEITRSNYYMHTYLVKKSNMKKIKIV